MRRASFNFRCPAFVSAPGGRFALASAWRVVYRGETYAVPAGFVTDGASIPAWIQWLCGSPWEAPRLYAGFDVAHKIPVADLGIEIDATDAAAFFDGL